MAKQTYWIADPNGGAKALVEGADERDRWIQAHGWVETSEPVSGDMVWVHNPQTDGRAVLPHDVTTEGSYWRGVGFAPSAPTEPADLTRDPVLRDQQPAAKTTETTTSTAAATGSDKKEKASG